MSLADLRICAIAIMTLSTISQPEAQSQYLRLKAMASEIPVIPARPADVSTIDAVLKTYYEVVSGPAGQPRQWARDRTLYIPEIRFIELTEDRKGNAAARSMTHTEFVETSDAALGKSAFYEHEIHRITYRFGNIAHVLSTAEQQAAPEGPAIGHSIDNLELFYDGHRWWIVSANIWNPASPGQALPKEFMP
jgi:hypothetical protein